MARLGDRSVSEDGLGSSARWLISSGLWPLVGRGVGDERAQVDPVRDFPVQQRQQGGVEEEVEVGHVREVRYGEELPAGGRLEALAGRRLFAASGSDRPLRVEERAERAAGQDAVGEAFAALAEAAELEGGAPGHLYQGYGLPGFLPE